MIVSASYRTDIPAFYGPWFMNRLNAGFCDVVNPYGGRVSRVALDPASVSGLVFWTKNIGPFAEALEDIRGRGYPFTVQYTINNLPRALETSVTDWARSAAHFHDLARAFGPRVAVWRYDPIIVTSLTPPDWHVENFHRIARRLRGATDEAVISFAHIYAKTRRNLDIAAGDHGITWRDPDPDEKRQIASRLAAIAADVGMTLTICAQNDFLIAGAAPARCIDADRLSDVAGRPIAARIKGNRPDCGCFESRDIGDYDTCPHGCVYCYAVRSRPTAHRRFASHDPAGETLRPRR